MKRLLLFSVLSIFYLTVSAQTKTWIGPSGGSFNVSSNWNPMGIPSSINDVIIPTGSNILLDGANIKSINIQGNAVATISGNLVFTNNSSIATNVTITWYSGAINGNTITNNGIINLSGVSSKGIDGNTMFVNNGTINIDSDGFLMLTNVGHTFSNTSSGVINLNEGGQITHQLGSGSGTLINSGLIKKQQSSGGFLILAAFENDNGTIAVENGTLNIDSSNGDVPNAVLTDGTYNVSSGQTLLWNGGFNLQGTLTGQLDGTLDWKGTVNVLTGTEAIFDFSGPSGVTWSSGLFQGDGTLTNLGIINLEGTQGKTVYGQSVLKNEGIFNINSDGFLVLTNTNPTFNNTATGVINLNAGGQITYSAGSGRGLLINSGLIKKQQSNDWFGILADFHNNNGTITVTDGNLTLNTPNAVLTDGFYNVTNGNTLQWSNVVTLEGTLTGQLDGQLSWIGNVNVPSGTEAILNFNNPSGINWNSGDLLGGGTLSNTGVINLVSGGWGISAQSTLKNERAINFNDSGYLVLAGNSTIENTSSGIIYLNTGGQITYSTGSGALLNSGLVKKQVSTDWFGMFATINNLASGTFESETGLLEFMNYAGTGTLTGNGSVKLPSGTTFEGTISPGGFPGTLTHEGNYTASANAILATEIYGPTTGTEYDVFDVQGNAIMDGNILVSLNYAANLNDEFVILTANNITSCNLPATVTAHHDGHNYTFDVLCNPTNVTLKITDIVLGTEENTLSNISMYPNPSNGHYTINLGKEYTDVTVQIYNMLGQQISSEKYASAKVIEKEVNASAGVYFVKVSTAKEGSKTLRIIKQ